jgi:hypothetical protein
MDARQLKELSKDDVAKASKNLNRDEIHFLVEMLNEKDEAIRYHAFLLLQSNSRSFPFVYEYWNNLEGKLENPNSYQRSVGVKLIAENVKWDKNNRFNKTINKYLNCCTDEKFITARQTIQALETILKATDQFNSEIKEKLISLQLEQYKKTQQKLLNQDRLGILQLIESNYPK